MSSGSSKNSASPRGPRWRRCAPTPRRCPVADAPHPGENTTDTELDRAVADILTEMRTADPARATELGRRLVELLDSRNAADATRTAEIGAVATGIDRA